MLEEEGEDGVQDPTRHPEGAGRMGLWRTGAAPC